MPPPPPHLVITPRTRDFSPVLLTILIEYNSAFKNIEHPPPPPHLPRPSENNDIRFFFKFIFNAILLGNQSTNSCSRGIISPFRSKTQIRRETSVGNCTLRNVKVFQKCIIYECIFNVITPPPKKKETKSPIRCQSLLKLKNANDHAVIHFASNFRVYSYRMTL